MSLVTFYIFMWARSARIKVIRTVYLPQHSEAGLTLLH